MKSFRTVLLVILLGGAPTVNRTCVSGCGGGSSGGGGSSAPPKKVQTKATTTEEPTTLLAETTTVASPEQSDDDEDDSEEDDIKIVTRSPRITYEQVYQFQPFSLGKKYAHMDPVVEASRRWYVKLMRGFVPGYKDPCDVRSFDEKEACLGSFIRMVGDKANARVDTMALAIADSDYILNSRSKRSIRFPDMKSKNIDPTFNKLMKRFYKHLGRFLIDHTGIIGNKTMIKHIMSVGRKKNVEECKDITNNKQRKLCIKGIPVNDGSAEENLVDQIWESLSNLTLSHFSDYDQAEDDDAEVSSLEEVRRKRDYEDEYYDEVEKEAGDNDPIGVKPLKAVINDLMKPMRWLTVLIPEPFMASPRDPDLRERIDFRETVSNKMLAPLKKLLSFMYRLDMHHASRYWKKVGALFKHLKNSFNFLHYPEPAYFHVNRASNIYKLAMESCNEVFSKPFMDKEHDWNNCKHILRVALMYFQTMEDCSFQWLFNGEKFLLPPEYALIDLPYTSDNPSPKPKEKYAKEFISLMERLDKAVNNYFEASHNKSSKKAFQAGIGMFDDLVLWRSFGPEYYPISEQAENMAYYHFSTLLLTKLFALFSNENSFKANFENEKGSIDDFKTYLDNLQKMTSSYLESDFYWLKEKKDNNLRKIALNILQPKFFKTT